MDAFEFNRQAWDAVAASNRNWFPPVTATEIESARRGKWQIRVTACRAVPREWLDPLADKRVLCLGGGGGHQGPILAAAGADVTVVDLSEAQLEVDRQIANEERLRIQTVQGNMSDLRLPDDDFDIVVSPCSICFCPDVKPVWRGAHRVLRPGGRLISGMLNPVNYLFDAVELDRGQFVVRHKIPYSDLQLSEAEQRSMLEAGRALEFGHTLADLIAGQTAAGLVIRGFYEDRWGGHDPLSQRIAVFLATCAEKPGKGE